MNSKTLVVGIAGILLVALIGLVVMVATRNRNQTNQTPAQSVPAQIVKPEDPTATTPAAGTNSASQTQEVVVQITSQGFSPREVTVFAGSTVKFTNADTRIHAVASNPHPIHTDLPGFESGNLAPSESYSFTFAKTGDWGYHDHLNPSLRGTVKITQ